MFNKPGFKDKFTEVDKLLIRELFGIKHGEVAPQVDTNPDSNRLVTRLLSGLESHKNTLTESKVQLRQLHDLAIKY